MNTNKTEKSQNPTADLEKGVDLILGKDKSFWEKIKDKSNTKEISKQVFKTGVGTIASVAGVKSFYDIPAYAVQKLGVYKDKKKFKGIMGDLTKENFDEENIEDKKIAEIINLPIIDEMQKEIEAMKVPEEIKNKLMEELNSLIENYHQEKESLENKENEKLKETLDEYIETKITAIQATKEALNTFCVFSGSYGLRGVSYGFMDGVDRYLKLKKGAKKTGENVNLIKDVIVGGIKETLDEAIGKDVDGKDKTKLKKGLDSIKAWGLIARYVGIGATVKYHPENMGNSIDKAINALEGKLNLGDLGENFKGRIQSLPLVSRFFKSEEHIEAVSNNATTEKANATSSAVSAEEQREAQDGVNATDDNTTQEIKEQKQEEILEEVKEVDKNSDEYSRLIAEKKQEIKNDLDNFWKENEIRKEKKLTDDQRKNLVEFFQKKQCKIGDVINVLRENNYFEVNNRGLIMKEWAERFEVPEAENISNQESSSYNAETSDNETIEDKSEIITDAIDENSMENLSKSPPIEFIDKKLENVVNDYLEKNHIDKDEFLLKGEISNQHLKGLLEKLDEEKISHYSVTNFLRNQIENDVGETKSPSSGTFEIGKGDSIWTTAEKYLQAKYSDFNNLGESDATGKSAEALKTYNIDRMKDKIIEVIETGDENLKKQFGLEGIDNPDKITIDQLKNIKFDEIDKTVFDDGKLTDELNNKQTESIVKNNETLKDFFHKHPDAPRSTQNYQDILDGSGSVEKASVEANAPEISGETDEANITSLEDFKKMDILEQRKIIDDLHNQSREVDKITNTSEDAKDNLRKERAEANALKTKFIKEFNEQHQAEIKEYKNLGAEIKELEIKTEVEVNKNLEDTGKEIYRKSIIGRIFGADWDEEKWEKAKTLNINEVLNKKHSDIANKKLLSYLEEIKDSFGDAKENETVGEYLKDFEVKEAEKKLELDDKKEYLEKLEKDMGYKK